MPEIIADKYEVVEVIGRGGMGTVYKAVQRNLDRVVAIKMLSEELAADPEFRARFQQEATLVARLHHPNIVNVFDIESHNHTFCIIMEFLEGESLQKKLDRDVCLQEKEAALVCAQVARALDHAHDNGIIHRDIKPDNIHITPDGVAKVMDFGIARFDNSKLKTQTGISMGTPKFMSPEQVTGKHLDGQSDLYSLGVCLYLCLAGRPPFDGENAIAIATKHLYEPPAPPSQFNTSISNAIEKVVMKALEKNKVARFGTGEEMAAALEASQKRTDRFLLAEEGRGGGVPAGATRRMSASAFETPTGKSHVEPDGASAASAAVAVEDQAEERRTPSRQTNSPAVPQLEDFEYTPPPRRPRAAGPLLVRFWWIPLLVLLVLGIIALRRQSQQPTANVVEPTGQNQTRTAADLEFAELEKTLATADSDPAAALAKLKSFRRKYPNYRPEYISHEIDRLTSRLPLNEGNLALLAERRRDKAVELLNKQKEFVLAKAYAEAATDLRPQMRITGASWLRDVATTPTAERALRAQEDFARAKEIYRRDDSATYRSALQPLHRAVEQDPANFEYWIALAAIYEKLGYFDDARVFLNYVQKHTPVQAEEHRQAADRLRKLSF